MKRIAASVSLVALGASTINSFAADAADSSMVNGKPWSVSASLRGFYDSNINSASDGSGFKQHSWGTSISPSVGVALPMETTQIKASYQFTGVWFQKEPGANFPNVSQSHWDLDHQFNLEVDHQFNERYQVAVLDSFVVGQEPDMLAYTIYNTPQRLSGDNYRNYGSIHFTAVITPLISVDVGYANQLYNYADNGAQLIGLGGPPPTSVIVGRPTAGGVVPGASTAGLLDRIENTPSVELRFHAMPETYFSLGFIYDDIAYTANEPIGVNPLPGSIATMSDYRNSRSYIGYVGVNHNFNSQLTATAQVGAQSFDVYNDPLVSSEVTPWASASVQYNYQPQSAASLGFSYSRSATDLAAPIANTNGVASVTTDATYATLFATVHHAITPDLVASLTATYQHADFNNGPYNSDAEDLYMIGLDLAYKINPFLSVDAGYNFDDLESPSAINRGYNRHRFYVGVTGTY